MIRCGIVAALIAAHLVLPVTPLRADPAEHAGDARLTPATFADLPGWDRDDHSKAFPAFRRTCQALNEKPTGAPGLASDDLRGPCAAADKLPAPTPEAARLFFEKYFTPVEVVPPSGKGFLTGYFEPEYDGSLVRSETFSAPLLARPDDLVTAEPGETLPGLDPALRGGRRTEAGLEPYPDRAAIEDGALGTRAKPLVFLRDPVEAFIVHVQGSARIRLPDGGTVRVAYAGRNGHAYSSIGRIIVERGHVPLQEMNLERMVGWLKANPAEAREIMRQNRSFIFFRIADELRSAEGPIGGAGVPLTPGRSLAIDRTIWSYGLPFWLSGELPLASGGSERLDRLLIAQDTGTAIVGPARGDFYFGSGAEAGTRAGLLRHQTRFFVLWPKAQPKP
jgi:membrane-bound lytic murein transglycosylase A